MDRLYMLHVGPSGERLTQPRGKAKDDDQVEAAFRAAHPFWSEVEVAGAVAKARGGVRVTVPYYDLTVSAAKSVSVLHAYAPSACGSASTAVQDSGIFFILASVELFSALCRNRELFGYVVSMMTIFLVFGGEPRCRAGR
jgi:hypothetical protein